MANFSAAILDDRMQVNKKRSRVRGVSESAVAGSKASSNKSRSRLLSESAKAAREGPSKTTLSSITSGFRLGLHSHQTFSLLQSKDKQEQKCVLRASERKYEAMEDPEEALLRFVLVSNAMKNLQIRMRREKAAKRAAVGSRASMRL